MPMEWNNPALPWNNPTLPWKNSAVSWNNPSAPWKVGAGSGSSFTPGLLSFSAARNSQYLAVLDDF